MNDIYRELVGRVADEAGRLLGLVDDLAERLSVAEAQNELVADWSPTRIALVRSALQDERFADVAGYTAELEHAEAQLAAVQELRRRLSGEHT